MKKQTSKKLRLSRETIRALTSKDLILAGGGGAVTSLKNYVCGNPSVAG